MIEIIEERWQNFEKWSLKQGSHSPDSTFCIMEAVAYVAGEPWSDSPVCACPVISTFLRSWNDSLPSDAERDRLLKPLIPRLVNTKSTKAVEKKRSLMAADWLIRSHTPAWLRLAGLTKQAELLEQLPEITSMKQYPSLRAPLEAVRQDANAARSAAWAAARSAAWDAAWDVAWAVADGGAGGGGDGAVGVARMVDTTHTQLITKHCNQCGHEWIPRVIYPKACPACLSRQWSLPGPSSPQPQEEVKSS